MRLETFFEKFEQLAEAPEAVAKIRELVLDLAVTGRLVPQDPSDEPASTLLRTVEAQRIQLVSAGKIKTRSIPILDADELPFDLPPSWAWARLAQVGYELGQKVPDQRFTYIDVGAIDSGKGCISDRVETIASNEAPSRARKLVARGTVIYSTVRPYLLNVAIVERDFDPEPIASTAFGILHPFTGITNRYLFYWLRSVPFTNYVQAAMKGMAYPAINDEKFYNGFISVPPLAEQKRIVTKVDELMALCDRLEAQQQEQQTRHPVVARASLARFAHAPTPANLDFLFNDVYTIEPADLRKAILMLAVQGKLLSQDPNDEPVDDSLAKNDERRRETARNDRRADAANQALLSAEDRWEIAGTWSWRALADLVLFVDYRGKTPVKQSSGVRLLTAKNVRRGQINLSPEEFLSETAYRGWMTRGFPKAGDVLFTTEAPMGNAAVVELTERSEPVNKNETVGSRV